MCNLTSVAAFGANFNSLTWWFEVCEQRRQSSVAPKVQRLNFSTQSIDAILAEMLQKMETANGSLVSEETSEGITYSVPPPDLSCLIYRPHAHADLGDSYYLSKHGHQFDQGSADNISLTKSCPSPQHRPLSKDSTLTTQPPRALIHQLMERQARGLTNSAPNLNRPNTSHEISAAAAVSKTLALIAAPPKPPRAHGRRQSPLSPPRSPPADPPQSPPPEFTDSYHNTLPTPVPRSKPEKPTRTLQSRQISSPALLGTSGEPVYSQVNKPKKPTPAPRARSRSIPTKPGK